MFVTCAEFDYFLRKFVWNAFLFKIVHQQVIQILKNKCCTCTYKKRCIKLTKQEFEIIVTSSGIDFMNDKIISRENVSLSQRLIVKMGIKYPNLYSTLWFLWHRYIDITTYPIDNFTSNSIHFVRMFSCI